MLSELWKDFGIDNVDIHQVKHNIPKPDPNIPSVITLSDKNGAVVLSLTIPQEQDLVVYR